MKRGAELSATQWQIVSYAGMSSWGLGFALGLSTLTYMLTPDESVSRVALTAVVAMISGTGWFYFDRWCQRQILCPICRQSLFQRWILEVWIGFSRWFGGVPDKCPHCGARLSV